MRTETLKLLHDIAAAARQIADFTRGLSEAEYRASDLVRAATERKFEIIGEAMTRLRQDDSTAFQRIADAPAIIGFRNRIIHGYDSVDDAIVWDVLQTKLPRLLDEVGQLLRK